MNRVDFLKTLRSPVPNLVLKKYPDGDIMQYWGENPALYSMYFGQHDDFSIHVSGHTGVDIAGPHRTLIYAAHDGTVNFAGGRTSDTGGLQVYLDSPLLDQETPQNSMIRTAYAHFDELAVKTGDVVSRGALLGYMGNTGFVVSGNSAYWGNAPAGTGTHLHFGLHESIADGLGGWKPRYPNPMGNTVDPLPYISDPTPNDDVADGNLSGLMIVLQNLAQYLKDKYRTLVGIAPLPTRV
jgi:murein DD-endopeptidase MepM/ murein hydrolase activator NlpD